MKRTELELKKTFKTKISTIEKFLNLASKEDLLSEERKDIIAQIAVELRSLFCFSNGDPLIKTAKMDKELLFPFYDRLTPFNELGDFLLVGSQCSNNKCTFIPSTSIKLDGTIVPSTWLSYYSWINQIVIDLKNAEYPPLTRGSVIKLIADKNGAHVDPKIDPFIMLIETANVMPLQIIIDDKVCEADCSNLLCETIFSIAEEALFAYKYKPLTWIREIRKDFRLRLFDYSDDKCKRYKYTICTDNINLYSTNRQFPCEITSYPIKANKMLFKSGSYDVDVIRIEDIE